MLAEEFKAGQIVIHHPDWCFGVGQSNKYIILEVQQHNRIHCLLKLFCIDGYHVGLIKHFDALGLTLWE